MFERNSIGMSFRAENAHRGIKSTRELDIQIKKINPVMHENRSQRIITKMGESHEGNPAIISEAPVSPVGRS